MLFRSRRCASCRASVGRSWPGWQERGLASSGSRRPHAERYRRPRVRTASEGQGPSPAVQALGPGAPPRAERACALRAWSRHGLCPRGGRGSPPWCHGCQALLSTLRNAVEACWQSRGSSWPLWGDGRPSGPGRAPGQGGEVGPARGCPGAGQTGRACSTGRVLGSVPCVPLHTPLGPACAWDVCGYA